MKTIAEKPVIFNGEMVKALLGGHKSQTRRVIKPQPVSPKWTGTEWVEAGCDDTRHFALACPYKVGDYLWVRETFALLDTAPTGAYYRADYDETEVKAAIKAGGSSGWKPSIFMLRNLSRIDLKVEHISIERIQDISEDDAWDEGIDEAEAMKLPYINSYGVNCAIAVFSNLWDSINGKRGYGWEINPWVFAISFKKLDKS